VLNIVPCHSEKMSLKKIVWEEKERGDETEKERQRKKQIGRERKIQAKR